MVKKEKEKMLNLSGRAGNFLKIELNFARPTRSALVLQCTLEPKIQQACRINHNHAMETSWFTIEQCKIGCPET